MATALNKSFLPPAVAPSPSSPASTSTRDIMKISSDSILAPPADTTTSTTATASEKCAIIVGDTNNNNAAPTADVVLATATTGKTGSKPSEHRRGILLNAIQKPVVPCI